MGDIEAFSTPDSPGWWPCPELEELVSILEDTDLISEAWTEKLATASSERSADLVAGRSAIPGPRSAIEMWALVVSQGTADFLVSRSYALTGTLVCPWSSPELHLHPRLPV